MAVTAGAASGRPMRADARRNYDRVMAAAREVLRAQGEAATLDEIARRAGVGIGTLYRHFPTRYDLIAAVYTDDVAALERHGQDSLELPAWDALISMMVQFAEFGATKRALMAELVASGGSDSAGLLRCRETIRECARLVLVRAQAEGVARADLAPADLLRLVSGLLTAPLPEPEQLRRLLDVVFEGIRARPDAGVRTPGSR